MAVGLFALLLFLMGSLDTLFASSDRVEADFGDVQSLQEGDPVYLFGMKVGKVSSIDLLPLEPGQQAVIRVRLQMPLKYRPYLREDSIVKIDKSLTGNISVLIRESEGKPLPEGGRLKGAPAADFASVTEKANQVLYQGEQLLASVVRVVKEIETKGNLPSTAQNLGDIVEKLKAEILPLGTRIKGVIELVEKVIEENRLDLRNSVANLKETTAQGKTFAEKITSAPEQVTRSLSEIEKAGNSVTSLINENRNHVDSILEDLTLTAANASNLTSEIKRRPWRLLFRPNESEIKAMDLYDAAWAYNLGATELNRSLRDFESHQLRVATGNSSAKDLEAAKARVEQSILKQKQIEELFWEKLRASE
jgi:ABC-type transporter Mla subunit MlaD